MKFFIALAALSALTTLSGAEPQQKETTAQREARMKWWREARFGMFIHWGIYSVPAGKYGNSTNYGEWIMESAHIPLNEYEQFLHQFNPTKFDAAEWARMAKDAGMKYVTITTKHHDGFALFDSKVSEWDVMSTPFKRDIMKELSTAVRNEGLTMCWYHSIMDWHHPDYTPHRAWSTKQPDDTSFERYEKYLHAQVTEILKNYGPIGVMWFDGEWERTWNHDRGQKLYDLCRKLQPKVIVNNRVDVGRGGMGGLSDAGFAGDFGTPEQEIPAQGIPGVDWESCMTMNGNWGYNAWDKNFNSTTQLITNLVDIVSKGGNYLLNVGPKADGTFPEESVQRLKEIGAWMKVNGESIYGTQASPFKKLPWGRATQKRGANGTTIYLQVLNWPRDGKLVVPGLGNDVLEAQVLGSQTLSEAARSGADVVITVPKAMPNLHCGVVKVTVKGAPIIYETPEIVADTSLIVDPLRVTIVASKGLQLRYTLDGKDPSARSAVTSGALMITKTCTLKVQAFHKGQPVSGIASHNFRKAMPWAAESVEVPRPEGLQREVFKGDWNKCPNWDQLKPESIVSGKVIGLDEFKSAEFVGMRFTGYIIVPSDGVYSFSLLADDGAKMSVDGKLLVDHDGLHSPTEKLGSVPLAKGYHRITVEWFNKTGGGALGLKWGKAGTALKDIDLKSLAK